MVYFIEPPVGTRLGYNVVFTAFVAMPEAAVDEDDGLIFGKYYIWFAGHVFYMEAVTKTMCMQITARAFRAWCSCPLSGSCYSCVLLCRVRLP